MGMAGPTRQVVHLTKQPQAMRRLRALRDIGVLRAHYADTGLANLENWGMAKSCMVATRPHFSDFRLTIEGRAFAESVFG